MKRFSYYSQKIKGANLWEQVEIDHVRQTFCRIAPSRLPLQLLPTDENKEPRIVMKSNFKEMKTMEELELVINPNHEIEIEISMGDRPLRCNYHCRMVPMFVGSKTIETLHNLYKKSHQNVNSLAQLIVNKRDFEWINKLQLQDVYWIVYETKGKFG